MFVKIKIRYFTNCFFILLKRKLYNLFMKRKKKIDFFLLPPPNVNADLHLGHALVSFVINFFTKSKQLLGKNAKIIAGTDHGGISTYTSCSNKNENFKNFKKKEKEEFLKKFALDCQKNILNQLKIFNLEIDWEKLVYTLDEEHSNIVLDVFREFKKKGLIVREKILVNWVPALETTISDLEIKHIEKKGYLYNISYELEEGYIQIATTKPETIFADVALAVHPEDKRYVNLIGKKVKIPIINKLIPIVASREVDMNYGTGVLKITPTLSSQDLQIAQRINLKYKKINILDKKGLFDFSKFVDIKKKLTQNEAVEFILSKIKYTKVEIIHTVPVHDKTNNFIINRLKSEWILKISHLKDKIPIPKFNCKIFEAEYKAWLFRLRDWCISRQTGWGHKISKKDHLDTWFSSALWFYSIFKRFNITKPIDIFVTGKDILFFWVARIVICHYLLGEPIPFKKVFLHGLIVDENGNKMSKTRGNVINPLDYIEKYGIDLFKFALLKKVNEKNNISFSENDIKQAQKILVKLINFCKFVDGISDNKIIIKNSKMIKEISMFVNKIDFEKINEYMENLSNFTFHIANLSILEYKENSNLSGSLKLVKNILVKLFFPIIDVNKLNGIFYNISEPINLDQEETFLELKKKLNQ